MLILQIALGILLGWLLINFLPALFVFIEENWKMAAIVLVSVFLIVLVYGDGWLKTLPVLAGALTGWIFGAITFCGLGLAFFDSFERRKGKASEDDKNITNSVGSNVEDFPHFSGAARARELLRLHKNNARNRD